ncbi:MAG: glycosyltransferase family 4 protein [Methanotrichaceae archaeon]|nr:glycosyltransferase family 4 protein [Methanotrichaceae archaeon]
MPRLAVLHYALGRFGGAAKIAILQAAYLSRKGFNVEMFYGGPILDDWKRKAMERVPVNSLPLGLPKSLQDAKNIIVTLKELRAFDAILVSYGVCPFFAFYLTMFFGRKVVWYCGEPLRALWEEYVSMESLKGLSRTVEPTSRMLYGKTYSSLFLSKRLYNASIHIIRTLDRRTAKSYRKIIANSRFTGKMIDQLYNRNDGVAVVYPGIDLAQYPNVEVGKCQADFILAVGAMIPMKNHITLLKAFKKLQRQHKAQTKLVIVGDGPLKSEILSAIQELNLNVELKANLTEEELFAYYMKCRFVVHVALYEPFGLVPLEAAVFGKPAIVSSVGGPKEIVVNSQTGLLVNPFDPEEISNAMSYLIGNKKRACEMGLKAQKRVIEEFNMEKSSERIAEILRSII